MINYITEFQSIIQQWVQFVNSWLFICSDKSLTKNEWCKRTISEGQNSGAPLRPIIAYSRFAGGFAFPQASPGATNSSIPFEP
jgi:hypothetical protein